MKIAKQVLRLSTRSSGVLYGRPLSGMVYDWRAPHSAAAANCTQAIQMLESAGADVNAKEGKVRRC